MIQYLESTISAYHNYLVNDVLTPGFLVGNPNSQKDFFFLADLILPGEKAPRISARLLDRNGACLVELYENGIRENPGGCVHQPVPGGSRILFSSGATLLEITTENYPNGDLTKIRARLFDEMGHLRMEPVGESIRVYGEARLVLDSPFASSRGPSPS
jgi:hypothetical protein